MAKKLPITKFMKSEMDISEVAKKCIELGWKISKSSDEMIIAKTPTSFLNWPHHEMVEIVKEDGGYIVNSQYFNVLFRKRQSAILGGVGYDPIGKNAKNLDKIQKSISTFCESCGAKIKANQVICIKCGVKI
jgi:hypothetical protein